MASGIYNRFKANLMNKEVDLEADDIKVALLDNSHSFSTSDETWSQVSANEISGTGYTTSGLSLSSVVVTQADTTTFDAADSAWTTSTFTAYHVVLYDDTLASDDLICSFDLGGAQTITSGVFTIQWHTDGIITLV